MKKLIGTVAVAALVATAAFAEISVSGWGRALWAPVAYNGDLKMSYGTSWSKLEWGKPEPRVGLTVAGDSENIGFVFNFRADGADGGFDGDGKNTSDPYGNVFDQANVWAKPWDWLKVTIGKIQDDTLRVNNGFGQFAWLRAGAGYVGEDLTFRRIGGGGGYKSGGDFNGAELALTPIDGLYIAAGFKMDGNKPENSSGDFVDVLKVSQYAAGYKIEDLLAIKAQYIGGNDYGIINAAVDLLMIENNYISVGAYIPTDFDEQIAISAVYNGGFDALSLNALVGVMLQNCEEYNKEKYLNTGLEIGVGVGYDLGNGLAIEADVRTELFFYGFEERDAHGDVSIGAFFTKGFSNGKCGVGAEVAIPFGKEGGWEKGENYKVDFATLAGSDKVSFAIPVMVEFWF